MRFLRAVVPWLLSVPGVMAQTPMPTPVPTPTAVVKPVRTYQARRAGGGIQVDGVLDETAWQQADRMELPVETFPGDNIPAPVKTEGFIVFDDKYLYVGIRAQDPEPRKIRAHLSDRDKAFSDDFVGVVLDTFNDERRGFEFFVNPLGVQMDLFQNDVGGERGRDLGRDLGLGGPDHRRRIRRGDGDPVFVAALPARPRRADLGDRHAAHLPAQPAAPHRPAGPQPGPQLLRLPVLQDHGLRGDHPGPQPGVRSDPDGAAHRRARRVSRTDRWRAATIEVEPGLTARWGITPNLTLNAALNPDFSQVEADVGQLDINTQFALFFPEKRPFFLEGADFFQTPIQAVYTRTVADPDWGIKLTGKEGKSAIGVFVARDDLTNLIIPGSQSSRPHLASGTTTTPAFSDTATTSARTPRSARSIRAGTQTTTPTT